MIRLSSVGACFVFVCVVCVFTPAVMHARQTVTVTPDIKADALKRLDLARSAQIPQSMVQKDGAWLRICNKGAKSSDFGNQEEACSRFVNAMWGQFARPRSLDDLLPAFKYCAISSDCSISIAAIAESGHPDYALALAEYAPNCKGCGVLGDVSVDAESGTVYGTLYLGQLSENGVNDNDPSLASHKRNCETLTPIDPNDGPPRTVCKGASEYLALGNRTDVERLLERGCTEAGRQSACQLYQSTGGHFDEASRSKAAIARQNDDNALVQARKNQDSSYYQAEAASQQRSAALVAAVNPTNSTIQDAAVQQQTNLQGTAAAIQQRKAASGQFPAQNSRFQPASDTSTQPTQSSLPNTVTSTGLSQGSCTDMTSWVKGTVKVGSDGWVIGYLTNNSNQPLYVSYTFKQDGVPSTAMSNAGATTIQGGQTVGGEGQGLYSTGADKNPPEIYWYAVLKSEHDQYGCGHKW